NGRHGPAGYPRSGGRDLCAKRAHETAFVDCGVAYVAVEVTVRAFRQAKRPVDVHTEARPLPVINVPQGKSPQVSGKRARGGTSPCPKEGVRVSPRSAFHRRCAYVRPGE